MSEAAAVRFTSFGLAYLLILLSLEYLVALRHGALSGGSLLAWDLFSVQPTWLYRGWRLRLLNALFAPPLFALLMVVRCVVALLAAVYANTALALSFVLILLAITLLTNLHHVHGRDGADDMTVILLAGLCAYYLLGPQSRFRWIGLLFVVAQVTLSYAVSGWAKVASPKWRTGLAIRSILATHVYGRPEVLPYLEHPPLARGIAWLTILWESTFPLIWVVPYPWSLVWLAGGIAFHVGVAATMGLNTFLVAFLSTYPLVLLWLRCPFLAC